MAYRVGEMVRIATGAYRGRTGFIVSVHDGTYRVRLTNVGVLAYSANELAR